LFLLDYLEQNIHFAIDITGGKRKREEIEGEIEQDDQNNLPFVCLICKQPFRVPVVTLCGFFFF
jgi:RING finger protein 113A